MTFQPHFLYENTESLSLHQFGKGPFCKFKVPGEYALSGVYGICLGNNIVYIGECANLSQRFNSGYGNITPRNCFKGGQHTNCRINTLILHATNENKKISLYFHECNNRKQVESELIDKHNPPWNLRKS